MKLYFIEVDDYSFLSSFKHESFFSNHPFEKLETNDTIIYMVDKKIAGIAKYLETNKVGFSHVFLSEERTPLVGMIRNLLNHEWGNKVEENLSAFSPVCEQTAKYILKELDTLHSSLGYFLTDIDYLLEEAEKIKVKNDKIRSKEKVKSKFNKLIQKHSLPNDTTDHTKAQFYLKEIARITNTDVWTASNDKNRIYNGNKLGEDDKENFLDKFEMDQGAKKGLSLIDTIWFNGDFPLAAFEVECTTSVYSGILRMADFVSVMPNKKMNLYIVAPQERKEKVMKELNRPIFKVIGLQKLCKFVSIESLEVLYLKIQGLDGYVNYDVIEAIALNIEEMEHIFVS